MPYAYDPDLAPIVPLLPTTRIDDVDAARAGLEAMVGAVAVDVDTSMLDVEDRLVPGFEGAPDVAVRAYRPKGAPGPLPALLYLHGGGFVLGSIAVEHPACAVLARNLGALVVAVEYRLAPEHPFPAGLHDCYATLCWLHEHAESLGVDPARVATYGQSAGGGLSAGLALFARDRDGPGLCFQFLGIPELDDRLDTPSMRAFTDTPLWNRPNAELSWSYYLGDPRPAEVSPYAAPARADDLAGLPPAYVSTMEFDPLRDEGIRYALALLAAGVPTELHSYPGTFHGSSLVPGAAVSRRMAHEQLGVLRRALGIASER
jgi:acetyl esterase/lipase